MEPFTSAAAWICGKVYKGLCAAGRWKGRNETVNLIFLFYILGEDGLDGRERVGIQSLPGFLLRKPGKSSRRRFSPVQIPEVADLRDVHSITIRFLLYADTQGRGRVPICLERQPSFHT